MTKAKQKEQSLRQKMREKANSKLEEVLDNASNALSASVLITKLDPIEVARMLVGGQTKTLRDKLVTQLTNQIEQEMVEIWNNQQDLDLGADNDNA
jgi:hypothetical protein